MTPPQPLPEIPDAEDPAFLMLGHYLRKNAEFEAKQQMERLLEEARQEENPQTNDR